MENQKSSLFQVYLRLRPPPGNQQSPGLTSPAERFLSVEDVVGEDALPTHITLNPPNDNRRRAVEKFAFTKVFEEESSQLDLFQGTGVLPLVEGVLGPQGGDGRDGLLATLGVTGSGKSHTILGSRNQRGLTQLALDVLFRSIAHNILDPNTTTSLHATVAASDPSESQVMSAQMFLDTMYGDLSAPSRASSRAPTPMVMRISSIEYNPSSNGMYPVPPPTETGSPKSIRVVTQAQTPTDKQSSSLASTVSNLSSLPSYMQSTIAKARRYVTKSPPKGDSYAPAPTPRRQLIQRPSVLPQLPDISNVTVDADPNAEYAILISMYEVYNDRIYDLLTPATANKSTKDSRRRPLLFKPTEQSPDRKVVAGLRKIICGTMKEALMVLEAGLHERRVAGTGSNSVSSRSHGFFSVEVKKRRRSRMSGPWGGSALTIVDLAGSERARDAKTAGATLQEAGKINESLMYLGQCLQMQSDIGNSIKPNLVPFRQCKLTELLFSNSFPNASATATTLHNQSQSNTHHRNPQKAIMIVTADPLGDFNATSQILRYSALAREITVPRIPSVTSTIMAQSTASHYFSPRVLGTTGGRSTPTDSERETMEIAALEIARMSEEIDGLRVELKEEQERRFESEARYESLSERTVEIELEIREEVFGEMEKQMQVEMRRWKASVAAEADHFDERMDRKLDILSKTIDLGDEDENKENANNGETRNADLEDENARLRREVEMLRRELQCQSPSKKSSRNVLGDIGSQMERLSVSSHSSSDNRPVKKGPQMGSPLKKVRKLTAKKWDVVEDDDVL
ncbi:kinesin family protein-like protein [Amylocarpus encephaloides]|uniref:Kinesin family protein-like protein n=1 Tax=Amylocarpus encephaloides TaxID=45428 RepID=A0A9P7YFT9_9HELO|nr:kinesin family protein-like protein [Amylocarpus encephaloides]